jgi:DNA-binding NtrC family response regulator
MISPGFVCFYILNGSHDLFARRILMKEDAMLPMPAPLQGAADPGNVLMSRSPRQDREGAVEALACSLDNLYGCIELINEGRSAPIQKIMNELERSIISQAMIQARANIRKAAALLGIKYTTLYAKIRKHGLYFSKAMRFYTDGPGPDI